MKKTVSIRFLFGILLTVLALVLLIIFMKKADLLRNNKTDLEGQYSEEVTNRDLTQDSSEETLATDALYILKLEQERVVIYYAESGELYDETDITSSVLPEDLVRKLQQGIQVHSLKELYDFLENYSS